MSLVQYLRNEPWDNFRSPPGMYDDEFGRMIDTSAYFPHDVSVPHHALIPHPALIPHHAMVPQHLPMSYYRPWHHVPGPKICNSQIHSDKEGFHVAVDVKHFTPDEITVKNVDDVLVVEGKHEERKDEHGSISRHFLRRYTLPKDVQPEAITSNLSSDGLLCIFAPKAPVVEGNVRTIPIQTTGVPAVHAIKPTLAPMQAKKTP